jgi:hypothetical protein
MPHGKAPSTCALGDGFAVFDRILQSDTPPSLDDLHAFWNEIRDGRLVDLANQTFSKRPAFRPNGRVWQLLSSLSRYRPEPHNDDKQRRSLAESIVNSVSDVRWLHIRDELLKFAAIAVDELKTRRAAEAKVWGKPLSVTADRPEWIKEHFRQQQYKLLNRLWGGKDVAATELTALLNYTNSDTSLDNLHRRVSGTNMGLTEKADKIGKQWEIRQRKRGDELFYFLRPVAA